MHGRRARSALAVSIFAGSLNIQTPPTLQQKVSRHLRKVPHSLRNIALAGVSARRIGCAASRIGRAASAAAAHGLALAIRQLAPARVRTVARTEANAASLVGPTAVTDL